MRDENRIKNNELIKRMILVFFVILIGLVFLCYVNAMASSAGVAEVYITNNYLEQDVTIFVDGEEYGTYLAEEGGPHNIDDITVDDGEHYFKAVLENEAYDYNFTFILGNTRVNLEPVLKNWTFMVYLDADNDLEKYGIKDLNEMEKIGSSDEVNVLVLFDRWNGTNGEPEDDDTSNGNWTNTKAYFVTKDDDSDNINSIELDDMGEENMGDPNTLSDFVNNSIKNFPAQRYALVIWNHGAGFLGVCVDEQNNGDYLSMNDLNYALQNINNNISQKIDFIGFDACLMQMAEVGFEMEEYVDYCVASEETEPGDGWNYETILNNLTASPEMEPEQFARSIVLDYFNNYGKNNNYTMSAIDLMQLKSLGRDIDDFSNRLIDNFSKYENEIRGSRNNVQTYDNFGVEDVDLFHFASLIKENIDNTDIKNSSQMLMDAINITVIAEEHGDESENSSGLSIYFPLNQSYYFEIYKEIIMPNSATWDEFLQEFFDIRDWFYYIWDYNSDYGNDGMNDTLEIEFDVNTNQEYDHVSVTGYLYNSSTHEELQWYSMEYSVFGDYEDNDNIYFTIPSDWEEGHYYVILNLNNSKKELNDTYTTNDEYLYPLDDSEEGSNIYGWVNNSENGEPIMDVWIHVYDDDDYDNGTQTDDEGYYEMYLPGGTEYYLDAGADNYHNYHDEEIYIGEDQMYEYSFEMDPKPEENSKIYGWVNSSENGEAIEGVEIYISDNDEYENGTQTDDEGYYQVNVPSGEYSLATNADGYEYYYADGITIGDEERLEHSFELDPKPEENSQFYGWVDDAETGDPIEGAQVNVWENTDDYNNQTYTNETGYYEINVPEGNFNIDISEDDYYGNYTEGIYIEDKQTIEHSVSLDMKIEENSTFFGWVNNSETGEPIEGVGISFIDDANYDNWTGTDKDGFYQINVPAGIFEVNAWLDGFNGYYDEDLEIGEVETMEYSFEMDPTPEENSTFYGWVNNSENSEPIEDAEVHFYIDEKYHNSTYTDDNGYYELNVPEDTYKVYVEANGFHDHYKEGIEIFENEKIEYSIELDTKPEENSTIYGWVNNSENGDPIKEAWIHIYDDYDYDNGTQTDDMGYYEMHLPGGTDYYLDAGADNFHNYHYEPIYVGEEQLYEFSFEMDPKPEENSMFYGWVNDSETGDPLEGVGVHVWIDEDYDNSTQTDDEGYYEIHVYEGDFNLDFGMDGYYNNNSEDISIGDMVYLEFSVEMDPKYENSTFFGWINNSETGEPIEDADIYFYIPIVYMNNTRSEFNGYYEMNVPGDSYYIYVFKDGFYDYEDNNIDIDDDEILEYSLELVPKPPENSTFYGWVNDSETGEPIDGADIDLFLDNEFFNWTWTDMFGYYEMNVPEGKFDFEISAEGYFDFEGNNINIGDEEIMEYSIELVPAPKENSLLYGWVNDSETGDPIEDAWIDIYDNENDYFNNTFTDEFGYYEINIYEGKWEIKTEDNDGYINFEENFYIDEQEKMIYNILLDPIPPPNATVKGYLKDEYGFGIENAMAVVFSIMYDTDTVSLTNETGYFELDIWGGLNMIIAFADDYYSNLSIFKIMDEEIIWHNITVYNKKPNDAMICGNVTDEYGEPIEDAIVYLASYIIGFPFDEAEDWEFASITNETGYYEIFAPEGEYYLIAEFEDDMKKEWGYISEVELINGTEISKDITMFEPIAKPETTITFKDWNKILFESEFPFSMDGAFELTRFQIDFIGGNKDGFVNNSEALMFEELFLFMMEFEGEFDENTTEDDFYVDDIFYVFEEDFFENFELMNLEGSILNPELVIMHVKGNQTSNEIIEDNFTHNIEINVNYGIEDDEFGMMTLILPESYTGYEYVATDNISIMDLMTNMITLEYIDDFYDENTDEMILINASANTPPTIDAGKDITANEGDLVEFSGNADDIDISNNGDFLVAGYDFRNLRNFILNRTDKSTIKPERIERTGNGLTVIDLELMTNNERVHDFHIDMKHGDLSSIQIIPNSWWNIEHNETSVTANYTKGIGTLELDSKITIRLLVWGTDVVFNWSTTNKTGVVLNQGRIFTPNTPIYANYTYLDDGVFTVIISVADSYGGYAEDFINITINNKAPGVNAGQDKLIKKGNELQFEASFTDSGILDTHTIEWNFGDGNTKVGNLTPTHIYTKGGIYTVTVTVTDDDGGTGNDTLTVSVKYITDKETITFDNGASATIQAYITGENITIESVTNPDPANLSDIGIFFDVNLLSGDLIWLNITVQYKDLPENTSAKDLKIYYWDETKSEWVVAENTGVDTANKIIWANVSHLTIFAPRDHKEDIPIEEEYPDLEVMEIIFSNKNPKEGDTVKISVKIKNIGNIIARDIFIIFQVGEKEIGNTTIKSIGVGETETITLSWKATKGKHEVNIWVEADNEPTSKQGNNNGKKIINVKEDEFPLALLIIPVIIIVILIIVIIMKGGKSEEQPTFQEASQMETETHPIQPQSNDVSNQLKTESEFQYSEQQTPPIPEEPPKSNIQPPTSE